MSDGGGRPAPETAHAVDARIEGWFADRGWQIFDFQRETWAACAAGESGLIHAPTGTGKTLAAWFAAVGDWLNRAEDDGITPGLTVLWITPLRALAADTTTRHRNPASKGKRLWPPPPECRIPSPSCTLARGIIM